MKVTNTVRQRGVGFICPSCSTVLLRECVHESRGLMAVTKTVSESNVAPRSTQSVLLLNQISKLLTHLKVWVPEKKIHRLHNNQ